MTERKVLNKYFPPDFDPSKIPRLKRRNKHKVFSIRTMAPFNMMCLKCKGYIFKAKKFNSRMEESGDMYLDLKEYRFYIRCPTCCSEIIYRTDRENNDYVIETGAKRSFEAGMKAIRQAIKEEAAEKEELEKNPIKALEKRTEESMNEFKRTNQLQDLLEKCKKSRSREEIIDDTLDMIRREKEKKIDEKKIEDKVTLEKIIEESLEKQQQMKINNDRDIENAISAKLEKYKSEPDGKLNKLKAALLRKKISDKKCSDETEEDTCTSSFKESEESCTSKKIKLDNLETESVNILGLDYDSD